MLGTGPGIDSALVQGGGGATVLIHQLMRGKEVLLQRVLLGAVSSPFCLRPPLDWQFDKGGRGGAPTLLPSELHHFHNISLIHNVTLETRA